MEVNDELRSMVASCLAPTTMPSNQDEAELRINFQAVLDADGPLAALSLLSRTLCVPESLNERWVVVQWAHLADLSKETPYWRSHFGPLKRTTTEYRVDQSQEGSVTCILEAAVVALGQVVNDFVQYEAIRPILRLIANCCANNNINRSLIMNSPAIHWLQDSIEKNIEIGILLPTLYNVCIDYDESATDVTGRAYRLSEHMNEAGIAEEETSLTSAEAKLDMWKLLKLGERYYELSGSILADLLELSSCSALFDISIILGSTNVKEDATALNSAGRLFELLLRKGILIASTSTEAQASICQVCMNLLSQNIMQRALLLSPVSVQQFIGLPYLATAEEDREVDLSAYREGFLKLIYTISASPEYTAISSPDSTLMKGLLDCLAKSAAMQELDNNSSLSSRGEPSLSFDSSSSISFVLVLVNNALSDRARIDTFLQLHHSISEHIMTILRYSHDESALLPSLNLASRLAISPIGAERLYNTDIDFAGLTRLLNPPSSTPPTLGQTPKAQPKHTLAIQQEIPSLIRLLIKSQPHIIGAFTSHPIFHQLLTHATTTPDTTYKHETARLNTEILRQLASPTSNSSLPGTTIVTTPLFINPLLSLLTNSPPPQTQSPSLQQSSALFGLALYTTLFTSPTSPYYNSSARKTLHTCIETEASNNDNSDSPSNKENKIISLFTHIASTQGQGANKGDYENLKTILAYAFLDPDADLKSALQPATATDTDTDTDPKTDTASSKAPAESNTFSSSSSLSLSSSSSSSSSINNSMKAIAREMGLSHSSPRQPYITRHTYDTVDIRR